MKKTARLGFDVEKLDNGFLVNIKYEPVDYTKTEFLRFFFTKIEEVQNCLLEWVAKTDLK